MKSKSEAVRHTPGPWMIFPGGDIGSAAIRTPDHTVIRSGTVKGATIGEAMANARLIAVAPEMLDWIGDLLPHLEAIATGGREEISRLVCDASGFASQGRVLFAKAGGAL